MNAIRAKNSLLKFIQRRADRHQPSETADIACGNCGTLIRGNYCHVCGQSAHVHHSLLHLIEEMVHGLWHFDAKGWKTIPMLVTHPGQLTRRYIDGQRVRFISPLGLFLFMVFFMFFVFSFSSDHDLTIDSKASSEIKQDLTKDLNTEITDAKVQVAKAQASFDEAKKAGKNTDDEQGELTLALQEQKTAETNLRTMGKIADQVSSSKPVVFDSSHFNSQLSGSSAKKLEKIIQHAVANRELVIYKMKNNAYKFALILVPLSLPFLWLIFIGKKNVSMFDHAVFSLYSLSFMAFFASLLSVLFFYELSHIAVPLLLLIPPVHMFRQLKGTYQLSTFGALWRTFFLCGTACFMVLIFIIFIGALSLT